MLGIQVAAGPGLCWSKHAALAPQPLQAPCPRAVTFSATQSLSAAFAATKERIQGIRCQAKPLDSTTSSQAGHAGKAQPPSAAHQQDQDQAEDQDEGEWDEGEWDEGEDEMGEYEYDEGDEWEDAEFGEEFEEDEGEEEEPEEAAASISGGQQEQPGSTARQIPEDAIVAEYTEGDFVEVGYITDAHGLKGEVKIKPVTDEPKRRFGIAGRRLWLETPAPEGLLAARAQQSKPQLRRLVVERGRVLRPEGKGQKGVWGVKFKEVPDRTQAEALSHHRLLLAVCDRERIPRGTAEHLFYVSDLVGLRAYMAATGQLLGEVVEVHDGTGTYDTLRIRLLPNKDDIEKSRYRTVLVPFANEIVPTVDVGQKRLELAPPEGLLDLTASWKLRRPYAPAQQQQMLQQLEALEAARIQQRPPAGPSGAGATAASSPSAVPPVTPAAGASAIDEEVVPNKPAHSKTPRGSQRKARRAAAHAAAAAAAAGNDQADAS